MPSKSKKTLMPRRWKRGNADSSRKEIVYITRKDLQVGQILGEGGFAEVCEVSHPSLPIGHYAMKRLRNKLRDNKELFRRAAEDLANEAKILSILDHPNVLNLRALPRAKLLNLKTDNEFFIVTDRLRETLCDRIHRWKAYHTAARRQEMLPLKIDYACQIASALEYLHSKRILFRDLKPENIGWKGRNRVMLFDFGLSRELPRLPTVRPKLNWSGSFDTATTIRGDASSLSLASTAGSITAGLSPPEEIYYKMTICGTQRYMAREVLLGGNYNLKSDVYSFALVVWEMLTEIRPFHYMTPSIHKILVCEKGERPSLNHYGFPEEVQEVLRRSWEEKVPERWSMAQVCEKLNRVYQEERREFPCDDISLCNTLATQAPDDLDRPMVHYDGMACGEEMGIEVEYTPNWTLFLPHDEEATAFQAQTLPKRVLGNSNTSIREQNTAASVAQ